ncbi:MAG: hypothetical protein ACI9F1_001775, partial [Colwellia sp.]
RCCSISNPAISCWIFLSEIKNVRVDIYFI